MVDVFEVAKLLVENLKEGYGEDVGIVAYYGSYATGDASETSDLDMFYIPDEGKKLPLYCSFIFKELPFEFWPVSWGFAEKIASGKHSYSVAPSLIANAKVLYSKSEEDLERFKCLQKRIGEMQKPENKRTMIKEAQEVYKTIPFYFEKLVLSIREGDVASIRISAIEFINISVDCLALINQTYLNRVWWTDYEKLQSLEKKPQNLLELIKTISICNDFLEIEEAAGKLKREIRDILLAEQKLLTKKTSFQDVFNWYYPCIFEYVNKVLSACDKKNEIAMTSASAQIQNEISLMLSMSHEEAEYSSLNIYKEYRKAFDDLEFPDVASYLQNGDFYKVSVQIKAFKERAQEVIKENSVKLDKFEKFEELRKFIKEKSTVI